MKQIVFTAIIIVASCFMAFAQTNNFCPAIKLDLPNTIFFPDEIVAFSVKIDENSEKNNLTYEWSFSRGKILEGQGTPQIKFSAAKEDEGASVNVSVKVIGLPKDCNNNLTDIFGVDSLPIGEPVDYFGKIALDDRRYRLDSFIIQLANDPNAEGLIVLDLEEKDSRTYKTSLLKNICGHFTFRKFDLTRITFAISESKYEERTVLWIMSLENKPPEYVDENYRIIKAEEIRKNFKALFPKK